MHVAITIPAFNESKYIERCVRSVMKQDYPSELLSIYVVDGNSTDDTKSIVAKLSQEDSRIHLLENTQRITPISMNMGFKASDAPVQIILGAHAEAYPDFVKECVTTLNAHPEAALVGGIIHNVYENETSLVIGKAMSSPFGVGGAHFRTGTSEGFVDTVAFGAYRKEVLNQVGYFDTELARNQDDELSFRILKNGFKIFLSKKIQSTYYVRGSFGKLAKQYYQYGYWKVYVNKKHKAVTTLRQLIPFFFVMFQLSGIALSIWHPLFLWPYLATNALYLIGSSIFAARLADNTKELFGIMRAFATLHFTYGWGYFIGIIHFFIFGKKPVKSSIEISR